MPFVRSLALLLLHTTTLLAAEPRVVRDLAYAEPKLERRVLDVYAPAEGKDHPVIFWVHGGGWTGGDKQGAAKQAALYVERGFVFVAANYRLVPTVGVPEMAGDLAAALRFVHEHIAEYGGDPERIIVMGHSAGAHLAALVCTDERYLKAEKCSLAMLRGCVVIDSSFYDIPKRVKDGGESSPAMIKQVFTDDAAAQRECSPWTFVAKGKHIPPFLLLHVAERADTKAQAHWLAEKLKGAEIDATVVAAVGKTHNSINSELGVVNDAPTKALFEFLDKARK